jgi:hypothetical protein
MRYNKTSGFSYVLVALFLQLILLPLSLFLGKNLNHNKDWYDVFPLVQIISFLIFFAFFVKDENPMEIAKATKMWNFLVNILLVGIILFIIIIGFAQYGFKIFVKPSLITFGIVLIISLIDCFNPETKLNSIPKLILQYFGAGLFILIFVFIGVIVHQQHLGIWYLITQEFSPIAIFFLLLIPYAILQRWSDHWVSYLGAIGFFLIPIFGFFVPWILRMTSWTVSSSTLNLLSYLPLVGWGLVVIFLLSYPISSIPTESSSVSFTRPSFTRPSFHLSWSWTGFASLILGVAFCAWQLYEVQIVDHFTVWMIGFIPIPVIVLGFILILTGVGIFLNKASRE